MESPLPYRTEVEQPEREFPSHLKRWKMTIIEPFVFQFCTAFRERKQLADKVNEIIDYLNNGGGDVPTDIQEQIDDIKNRLDDDKTDISDLEASLLELNGTISDLETDIDGKAEKNWLKPNSFFWDSSFVTKNTETQKITLNRDFLVYYVFGNQICGTVYLAKGTVLDYDSTPIKVVNIPSYSTATAIDVHCYSVTAQHLFQNGVSISVDMTGRHYTVSEGSITSSPIQGTFYASYSDNLKSISGTDYRIGFYIR
jgi:hypothetical protein